MKPVAAFHRVTAVTLLAAGLSACSFTTAADVSGSGPTTGPTASAAERSHQDAQVVSNVMRADLANLSAVGNTCEGAATGESCIGEVGKVRAAAQQALADLGVLRIPAGVKPDTDALAAALRRTLAACDPVLTNTANRIAEAYAANEFDTAVAHSVTAMSKVEGDASS